MKALLVGKEPPRDLGVVYTQQEPYEAVVVGSLSLGQLLRFQDERVLSALAEGKPVILYTPGLPESPKNRALSAALASRKRELQSWGVRFTDGGGKRLITAQEARLLRQSGKRPGQDAVLTPLAKEIMEGSR